MVHVCGQHRLPAAVGRCAGSWNDSVEVCMPLPCPTCSRANPAEAVYCYYDGRALTQGSEAGPLSIGTLPFAMPFCFSDGHSCANFNQLALACDERWNEARGLLTEGIWASFFSAAGRLDLATAA